jgi:hypothetical protein
VKAVLLALAVGLTSAILATPSGSAGNARRARQHALLTIPAIGTFNKPIRPETDANIALGAVWSPSFPGRPGHGETMLVEGHDVTPVPGYDGHGPFYNLYLVKPGDLMKIKWNGVWRTYRFVRRPTAYPQSRGNNYIARYATKHPRVETVFIRCCWPRYTHDDWLTARAVLVQQR